MNILISGGSGLVGTYLTDVLQKSGHCVSHLSRSPSQQKAKVYKWDVEQNYIEEGAIEEAECIVHLAGANIADKRWTSKRKKQIIDSRVKTANLLIDYLKKSKHKVHSFISASGIGFYGNSGAALQTEASPTGNDFLAEVCQKWEAASEPVEALGIRRAVVRIGIVMSKDGGALPQLALPAKFGLASYFGSGKAYFPWVHLHDLSKIFVHLIENQNLAGIYNGVAPNPRTSKDIAYALTKVLNRPSIPLPAPSFAIKAILGEFSSLILNSNNVSSKKIEDTGFTFKFEQLEAALEQIYS